MKTIKTNIMVEVARKNSDEVSVEDEAFGDTDENIVHAATSQVLKPGTSQSKVISHRPTDSLRLKDTQNLDIMDDEHD